MDVQLRNLIVKNNIIAPEFCDSIVDKSSPRPTNSPNLLFLLWILLHVTIKSPMPANPKKVFDLVRALNNSSLSNFVELSILGFILASAFN